MKTKFYVFEGDAPKGTTVRYIGTNGDEVLAAAIQWADGEIECGRSASGSIFWVSVSGTAAMIAAGAFALGHESGDLSDLLDPGAFKYQYGGDNLKGKYQIYLEKNEMRRRRNKRLIKEGHK